MAKQPSSREQDRKRDTQERPPAAPRVTCSRYQVPQLLQTYPGSCLPHFNTQKGSEPEDMQGEPEPSANTSRRQRSQDVNGSTERSKRLSVDLEGSLELSAKPADESAGPKP